VKKRSSLSVSRDWYHPIETLSDIVIAVLIMSYCNLAVAKAHKLVSGFVKVVIYDAFGV